MKILAFFKSSFVKSNKIKEPELIFIIIKEKLISEQKWPCVYISSVKVVFTYPETIAIKAR